MVYCTYILRLYEWVKARGGDVTAKTKEYEK